MAESPPLENAGVRFPPPLLYLAGLAAGWALDHWRALPIGGPTAARVAGGAVGVLVWLGLFLSAWATFRRHRTTLIPNQPATAFVTEGPYRFTRNPMYVSLVALYVGVTVMIGSWWPVILLPLVVGAVDRLVIAREERYLADAFRAEYVAYARRVRRWL